MSFFNWFTRKPPNRSKNPKSAHPAVAGGRSAAAAQPGQRAPKPVEGAEPLARKNVRMERREALYMVVRDAMVRAGVLSAGYKFKVLSLDQAGQQFLVMIDLAREYGSSTARLSEIEALIGQSAKSRFDILVTAVYWRMHENAAIGNHLRRASDKEAAAANPITRPSPLSANGSSGPTTIRAPIVTNEANEAYEARSSRAPLASAPAPLNSAPAPLLTPASFGGRSSNGAHGAHGANGSHATAAGGSNGSGGGNGGGGGDHHGGRYDPIEADEVAAFKRALSAAAASGGAPRVTAASRPGTSVKSGPMSRSPLLQPSRDFADTEMPGASDTASSDLSATQYGDL